MSAKHGYEYDPHDHSFEKKNHAGNRLFAMACPHHGECANFGDCFECYHFNKFKHDKEVTK